MYRDDRLFFEAGKLTASDDVATTRCGSKLLRRVRTAFPFLQIRDARIEQSGGDHILLIVDERLAFRFPREGMHDLRLEIAVLDYLRGRTGLAIPHYAYVDPAGEFAGYSLITGAALTPHRFAGLGAAAQDHILHDVADFLSHLHKTKPNAVGWAGTWPRTWSAGQYAERGMIEQVPLVAEHLPQTARRLDAFFTRYRDDRPEQLVVVHGDLVGEHLLMDSSAHQLAGIIDFGDVALGDAAQDFLGLWHYGAESALRTIQRYDGGKRDPGLLGRSRNHFIRYEIDRLLEDRSVDFGVGLHHVEASLDALLRLSEKSVKSKPGRE